MRDARADALAEAFRPVAAAGLTLTGIVAEVKYDGSPRLVLDGCFVAGMATHPSAEPASLVVRMDPDERQLLLDEAPETYYVTEYYERHPVVLVRLPRVDEAALRDLLATSRRLTLARTRPGRRTRR